jgi:diguanylate cyclase (GGDEF)-like protein
LALEKIDVLNGKVEELQGMLCIDPMTGLRMGQLFHAELAASVRGSSTMALLYIDHDSLKLLNDSVGQTEADRIIAQSTETIRSGLRRKSDKKSLFRLNPKGDEFFVIVSGSEITRARAMDIAESVRRKMADAGTPVSIGVALKGKWNRRVMPEEIFRQAELAMKQAKYAGKNCVHAWSEEVDGAAVHVLPSARIAA